MSMRTPLAHYQRHKHAPTSWDVPCDDFDLHVHLILFMDMLFVQIYLNLIMKYKITPRWLVNLNHARSYFLINSRVHMESILNNNILKFLFLIK